MQHALVECRANSDVGYALMHTLGLNDVDAVLRLELDAHEEDEELPQVWLLAATLLSIWEQRQGTMKVEPYLVRAQLEAKVNLLRQTRLINCATILDLVNFI